MELLRSYNETQVNDRVECEGQLVFEGIKTWLADQYLANNIPNQCYFLEEDQNDY